MKIKVKVTDRIDCAKILRERGLGASREAAKFMASEVKRLSGPYVPRQHGTLDNEAQIVDSSGGVCIFYDQPYAHYQYYGEVMAGRAPKQYTGTPISYSDGGQRGKEWNKRMMADRGDEVTASVANFVGGRKK